MINIGWKMVVLYLLAVFVGCGLGAAIIMLIES